MPTRQTILVFDTGLGGLNGVARNRANAARRALCLRRRRCIFPLGHRSEEQVIARAVPLIGELIGSHAPDLVRHRL